MEHFRFSIISLNYNAKKILGDLLETHLHSLLNSEYDNFEVIFVDNGSTDGSVEYIKKHFSDERLKIVQLQKNYYYARGNNLALEFVNPNTDIVVFINNDTIVTKDWLKYLAEAFDDSKVGIAQPLILSMNTGLIQFLGGYTDQWGRTMTISSENNDKIDELLRKIIRYFKYKPLLVLWAYGACIAIRKDLLDKIGGFNELFLWGLEEQTLCIPAIRFGYKIVLVPKSIIYHKSGATASFLKLSAEQTYSRFIYILLYYSFPTVMKSLLGRSLIELFWGLRYPRVILKALLITLKNVKVVFSCRKKTYKLPNNSPFLIKTPIVLKRNKHIELTLKKLLEVNRKV